MRKKNRNIDDIIQEELKYSEYLNTRIKEINKKEGSKKGAVSEIQKNVSNALEKIKDSEKDHKAGKIFKFSNK